MAGMNNTSLLEVDFDTGLMMAFKINPAGQKSVMAVGTDIKSLIADYKRKEPACTAANGSTSRPGAHSFSNPDFLIPKRLVTSSITGKKNCKGGKSRRGFSRRNNRKTRRN